MSIKLKIKVFINLIKLFWKIIILLIELIISIIGIIIECLKALKFLIVKNRLSFVQLICVLFMIGNGFVLISDYLEYNYQLKLIISNNDKGLDLPTISICTESNRLFDKRKILEYFDISSEYSEYQVNLKSYFNCSKCRYHYELVLNYQLSLACCKLKFKGNVNYLINYIKYYEQMVFDEVNNEQMIALMMSSEELFECRASVHFANQTIDSNPTVIDNCFHRFRVLRDIYSNNDFGICYKLFDKNYQIRIRINDFVEIGIKFESLINLNHNFILYYFADGNTKQSLIRDYVFTTRKHGLKMNAILRTVSFEMLSIPFMQFCQRNGNYIFLCCISINLCQTSRSLL